MVRHDGVTSQDSVRAALFRPAICDDESCLPFFVNLVEDLGVREHFDVNNVLHIHRPRTLGEDHRRKKSQDTNEGQNLPHKSSQVCVLEICATAVITVNYNLNPGRGLCGTERL